MIEVVLINPKFEVNVANTVRAIAIFGADKLTVVGRRYVPSTGAYGNRKPAELRRAIYNHIDIKFVDSLDIPTDKDIVVVELLNNSLPLPLFKHPKDVMYIFGPEDGDVPQYYRRRAKHFVEIPSASCLNLAAAVNVVLYDRTAKFDYYSK